MLALTHILLAGVFAFIIVNIFPLSHPVHFFLLFCFAALLPDVDHPGSVLGRRLWPLSWIISFFFGHRGFFHGLFVPILFLSLGYYFDLLWVGVALAGGYCAHLVGDMFTVSGVKPFWLGPKVRGFIRTGGFLEVIFLFLLLLFFIILFFKTL